MKKRIKSSLEDFILESLGILIVAGVSFIYSTVISEDIKSQINTKQKIERIVNDKKESNNINYLNPRKKFYHNFYIEH